MKRIIELFEQLQNESSSNNKLDIIKCNKDNKTFVECLKFLLDTNITTGIDKKKYDKFEVRCHDWAHEIDLGKELLECLNYIKSHNTGRDEDILQVKSWCYDFTDVEKDFVKGLITKSIKLGVTSKSLNKCIPNAISTWEVQQAFPIDDKNKPKKGEWFSLSQKLNGTNCGVINGKTISRQGKQFKNLGHIIADIITLGLEDSFINGELIRNNADNLSDDENFQKSVSIINSDAEDKTEIKFVIYEVLSTDEFYAGVSKDKYKVRLARMKELDKQIKALGLKYIEVVPYFYDGTDQAETQKWLDYADSHNMEGCMLNKDTLWQNKRNNGILKVKSFKSCDIRCLRVEEGDGKNTGTLGKIVCNYKGYELGVGSGFTDAQRNLYWNHPEQIVGHIVTVKYKTETKNKEGGISVQFPIFQIVREDGKEESYN